MHMKKKKQKGRSVQELIGIESFTRYGVQTAKGEIVFFSVAPTNISVLSHQSIEIKIHHLMTVLSAIPDIEITCTDSSESFEHNQLYLKDRIAEEPNEKVRAILQRDGDFLDRIQTETATGRQFLFQIRMANQTEKQVFDRINRIEKTISEQLFEVRRLRQADIKRFLALYFGASLNGEQMPDVDGAQLFDLEADAG